MDFFQKGEGEERVKIFAYKFKFKPFEATPSNLPIVFRIEQRLI
jgi:hypothetical protein